MPLPQMPSRKEEPENEPEYILDHQEDYSGGLPDTGNERAAIVAAPKTSFLPTSMPAFDMNEEDEDVILLPEEDNEYDFTEEAPAYAAPASEVVIDNTDATEKSIFTEDDDEEDEVHPMENAARALTPAQQESVEMLLMHINDQQSSEVMMNGPAEIMIKVNGGRFHVSDIDFGNIEVYHDVINNFILPFVDTRERIGPDTYLVEGQLEMPDMEDATAPPTLARVHIIGPGVVKAAKVTIAKKARRQFTIDDLVNTGSMSEQMGNFLKVAAKGKLTTVLSGLSGSGKTTLLEAMSHHFDQDDRVLVIEDTQELMLPLSDVVYMRSKLARPGDVDKAPVTLEWLVSQANRMRSDRIIVGEVRGAEMSEFLVAANSGADGSMTTIHAGSPKLTLTKIVSLSMKNSSSKNEESIVRDIASTIQIVVQAALIDDRHVITHIEEISDIVNQATRAISTQTLFEYDRNTGKHIAKSRPSEKLQSFLAQRGIKLDPQLFINR